MVHWWPALPAAPRDDVTVIGIDGDGDRPAARRRIRAAVSDTLQRWTGQGVALHGAPGTAPWATLADGRRVALSISHEGALSVAAIALTGAVGIDLMREELPPDWLRLAHDYLGPTQAGALAALAPVRRPAAFAAAWSRHEACLKCRGLALREWRDDPTLAQCRVVTLDVPQGLQGNIALWTI